VHPGRRGGMGTLQPELTRRLRWLLLAVVLLIALVIMIHIAAPAPLADALTPLVGIVFLLAWAIRARR
jgi:hypothetical protein